MYLYIEEKTLIKFYKTKKDYLAQIDTGHFSYICPAQCLIFFGIHTLMSNLGLFKGLRSFRGPQKQERKNDHNSIIFGQKIK